MTDQLRAHIFDPFYTTKESGHGTGLGLVVVRQVIREHHGEIEIESKAGCGAVFRLKLPTIQQEAEGKQNSESRIQDPEEKQQLGLSLVHSEF